MCIERGCVSVANRLLYVSTWSCKTGREKGRHENLKKGARYLPILVSANANANSGFPPPPRAEPAPWVVVGGH
jgi:hypothetical protein